MGGDEFAVILETGVSFEGARAAAQKIAGSVSRPILLGGGTATVAASIGIAMFPEHGDDHDVLLHNADAAMYRAKRSGGGVAVFGDSASSALSPTLQIAS